MIGFLRGKVVQLMQDYCLLDVGGVGYRVYIPSSTRSRLKVGEDAMLYTHLAVREDAMTLYGFESQEEYQGFQLLISVSGIGPKVALGILSSITIERLFQAIHGQQIAVLTKLPGVGKKSAERLILELKDKTAGLEGEGGGDGALSSAEPAQDGPVSDAAAALSALGYSQDEISSVLRRVTKPMSTEETIRFALKEFAGRR